MDALEDQYRDGLAALVAEGNSAELDGLLKQCPAAANCTITSEDGVTGPAVYVALRTGKISAARVLLEHGARADFTAPDGIPLIYYTLGIDDMQHVSAKADRETLFTLAVKNGADIEAQDSHGMTALMRTCFLGTGHIFDFLLDHGASPNPAPNSKGYTPLMLAVISGKGAMIDRLLEAGADVNARNAEGNTPLHFTRIAATALRLIDAGANHACISNSGRGAIERLRPEQRKLVMDGLQERWAAECETFRDEADQLCHKPVTAVAAKRLKLKIPTTS
ncbi:MAG: ankyrin repeat domain-containing protein [Alphaproteobacteria bacterium]